MAQVRIEMDRGNGWEVRVECEAPVTAEQIAGQIAAYAIQYKHRAFLDGVLVAEAAPPAKKGRKAR